MTPVPRQGVSLDRAYAITFEGEKNTPMWSGFYNACKPVISTRGGGSNALANAANAVKFGRKRWGAAPLDPVPEATGSAPKVSKKK